MNSRSGELTKMKSMWKYLDQLPLRYPVNIVSEGEGDSPIIELEELSALLGGACCYLMLDSHHNPTGTFKDREGSLIISRCKEASLDRLVFYSTANTGRSYTHYATRAGLTTYCFLPAQCRYKNTDSIARGPTNYFIYVEDSYPAIAPYAKRFAEANGLNAIAPLEDRTAAYMTVAFEQHEKLPQCTYFAQTIASGMGPVGFLLGHERLVVDGLEERKAIPHIVCVQSSETGSMARAYNSGSNEMSLEDLSQPPDKFYEPTLNSSNPIRNYPSLHRCLKESDGIILSVEPIQVEEDAKPLLSALSRRGLPLRTDLEKSMLIEFSGLRRLAEQGRFHNGDVLLLMGCGRRDISYTLLEPDAIIRPQLDDPVELFRRLENLAR